MLELVTSTIGLVITVVFGMVLFVRHQHRRQRHVDQHPLQSRHHRVQIFQDLLIAIREDASGMNSMTSQVALRTETLDVILWCCMLELLVVTVMAERQTEASAV